MSELFVERFTFSSMDKNVAYFTPMRIVKEMNRHVMEATQPINVNILKVF